MKNFFIGNIKIVTYEQGEKDIAELQEIDKRILRDDLIERYREKIEKYQENIRTSEEFKETFEEMKIDHKTNIKLYLEQINRTRKLLKEGEKLICKWAAPQDVHTRIENLRRILSDLEQDLKDERHNAYVTSKLLREHMKVITHSNKKLMKTQMDLNRLLICNEIDEEVDRFIEFYGYHVDGLAVTRDDCISLRKTIFIPSMHKIWKRNMHYVHFEMLHDPHHWAQLWTKKFLHSVENFNQQESLNVVT